MRWLCLWCWLWWSGWTWAQQAPISQEVTACTPKIVRTQAAKADATGQPPQDLTQLEWHDVQLPDNWTQRWPGYTGAVWYRTDWHAPCADLPARTPAGPWAWGLHFTVMAAEIFLNQDLLERDAHLVEPLSRGWNLPRYGLLPASSLQPGTNHLWVRVHGHAQQTPGLGELRLGEAAAVRAWFKQLWWQQRTLITVNLVVSAVLGLMFACVWLQKRQATAYGWYALNALCWVLMTATMLMREAWPFPDTITMARANFMLFVLFTTSLCVFTWRFGGQHFPRAERTLWALAAAAWLIACAVPEGHLHVLSVLSLLFLLAVGLNTLQFPRHAWRTGQTPHKVFAVCMLLFMAVGMHDFGLLLHAWNGAPLAPYTAPVTMLALSVVLGRQVVQNMQRIQEFNHELRRTVQQACDELSTTLAREHALAIEHSRLQERLQIAHDLHDSLGGSLVRSIAYVEQTREALQPPQVLSMLKLMRDDLRQMIDHGTSHTFDVPATPAQWIAPLRHRFIELFDVLGMQSDWILPAHWGTRPSALQCLSLTRVTEEALTNILKHSRATQVRIELLQPQAREVQLRITDDGVGFDVREVMGRSSGVGMRSMRTRMERVRGYLHLASRPGQTVLEAGWGAAAPHNAAPAAPAAPAAAAPAPAPEPAASHEATQPAPRIPAASRND